MTETINPDDFEALLTPKYENSYAIKRDVSQNQTNKFKRRQNFRIYIYKKGVAYPKSYVGSNVSSLMTNLKISKEQARKLIIMKLRELMKFSNEEIKNKALKRIALINVRTHKPKNCIICGKEFKPRDSRHKKCRTCTRIAQLKFMNSHRGD